MSTVGLLPICKVVLSSDIVAWEGCLYIDLIFLRRSAFDLKIQYVTLYSWARWSFEGEFVFTALSINDKYFDC